MWFFGGCLGKRVILVGLLFLGFRVVFFMYGYGICGCLDGEGVYFGRVIL